jgi:exopolyphosphatase/guanosine-5'-triphosphate,3'-diphosphate pyrophosphatase
LVLGHQGKLRKLELNIDDHLFIEHVLAPGCVAVSTRLDPDLKGLRNRAKTTRPHAVLCRRQQRHFRNRPTPFNEEVLAWQKNTLIA